MNLERLRAVQAEEREADSLRPLSDAFYREVAEYLGELRAERERAAEEAEDPFGSAEVRRLTDEIETAEEVAEAIYERRVGKLVKRASLAAAGMPADEAGLTSEEADLFADLVDQIEAHRSDVLADFDGGVDATVEGEAAHGGPGDRSEPSERRSGSSTDEPESTPGLGDADDPSGGGADRAARGGGGVAPSGGESVADGPSPDETTGESDVDAGVDEPGVDQSAEDDSTRDRAPDGDPTRRVRLRITRDVGEVFGVDERTYDLAAEDVVTLPAANAKPLLDRDAAERLD